MSDELVRVFNAVDIRQRGTDGYLDATAMCKATGKKWSHYWATDATKEFIQTLAESAGIPADSLVESRSSRGGGTWVHPKVAMHLAQWCSPKFAVLVSGWVFELLTTGKVDTTVKPDLGPYTTRILAAVHVDLVVPEGHWCVFSEAAHLLIVAERILKPSGLLLDADDLLDGSVGRRYADYRRGQPWAAQSARYEYTFPPPSRREGVTVHPYAYPLNELGHFRQWMRTEYIPHHFRLYLTRKYGQSGYCQALPHIRQVLPQVLDA